MSGCLTATGARLLAWWCVGAGGVADLLWHETLGIEVAVDALVSPPHLMLGAGGLLILTSPLRALRVLSRASTERPPVWTLPALLSLVLTTALVAFFLLYTSPFATAAPVETFIPTPEGTPGHEEAELPVIAALGGVPGGHCGDRCPVLADAAKSQNTIMLMVMSAYPQPLMVRCTRTSS